MLIGVALIGVGLRLVRRSHDFLVGAWVTAAGEQQNRDVGGFTQPLRVAWGSRAEAFLLNYPGVKGIRQILTTFVGPSQVWIVARVEIDPDLSGAQVESMVRGIESRMQELEYIYRVDVVPVGRAQDADTLVSPSRDVVTTVPPAALSVD